MTLSRRGFPSDGGLVAGASSGACDGPSTTSHGGAGTRRRAWTLAAVTAACALTACSASSTTAAKHSSAASSTTSSSAPATSSSAAARDGLAKVRAAAPAIVEKVMRQLMVPGATVLVSTPSGRYEQSFGVSSLSTKTPMTSDDHVRIGSVTKTMTGTVIMQLAQEGRLKLTDPISKYYPSVPNGAHITLAEMLNMRSGLVSYTELEPFNRTLDTDPGKAWNPQALAKLGLAEKPYFAPDTGYHYSNTNTVLLGLVAEKITGQTLQQLFQRRIFTPLGMTHTSMPAATDSSIPAPYSHGYLYGTNVSTLKTAVLPAAQQAAAKAGTLKPHDVTNANPSWGWAAGGVISTAGDLAIYAQHLVAGGLLDAKYQQVRLDSLRLVDPSNPQHGRYGYALLKLGNLIGHNGSLPGYQTFIAYDPTSRTTLVVCTNLQNSPSGQGPADTLARSLAPLVG